MGTLAIQQGIYDESRGARRMDVIGLKGEPGLTYQLLGFVSRRIRAGDIEALIKQGVSVEVIDMLRSMTADQLTDLAGSRDPLFNIKVESVAFFRAIKGVQMNTKWSEQQSYFVQQGATVQMMQSLFKLSRANIRELRRWMCSEPSSLALPDEQDGDAILLAWQALASIPDIRDRLIELHRQNNRRYTLRGLWQVIESHEVATIASRTPRRARSVSAS